MPLGQGCQLGSFQLGLALLQGPGICREALQGSAYCTVQVLDALRASPVSRWSELMRHWTMKADVMHAAQTAKEPYAS